MLLKKKMASTLRIPLAKFTEAGNVSFICSIITTSAEQKFGLVLTSGYVKDKLLEIQRMSLNASGCETARGQNKMHSVQRKKRGRGINENLGRKRLKDVTNTAQKRSSVDQRFTNPSCSNYLFHMDSGWQDRKFHLMTPRSQRLCSSPAIKSCNVLVNKDEDTKSLYRCLHFTSAQGRRTFSTLFSLISTHQCSGCGIKQSWNLLEVWLWSLSIEEYGNKTWTWTMQGSWSPQVKEKQEETSLGR